MVDTKLQKWIEENSRHECTFAKHPLTARVEYCQFCGVLREARS